MLFLRHKPTCSVLFSFFMLKDVDDINWDIQVEEENEEEKNRDSLSAETDKKKELTGK